MAPNEPTRRSEATRLKSFLEHEARGVRICGISGPGGIGKSYLLRHVLDAIDPAALHYLVLDVDGSNPEARGDFFGLVAGQLAKSSLPAPADPAHDYFPAVREIATLHRELVDAVAAELGEVDAPEAVKDAALTLLKAGRLVNKTVPRSRILLDVSAVSDEAVDRTVDDARELGRRLRTLRDASNLPSPLRRVLGRTRSSRVKHDLYNVTADALREDLGAFLGPESRARKRAIPGVDKLLLVVDDFEAIAPVIEDFLIGALVPRLADAPFQTSIVVLGRDDLEAMSPGWAQHGRRWIVDRIRLAPLSREESSELLAAAGIAPEEHARIHDETNGLPFLLAAAIEQASARGSDGALFLRRFFDRTTRWMSPRQRDWFVAICYLDAVNEDTLRRVLPGEDSAHVQDWFEREASIRDPSAPVFRVRDLIRDKVLRYMELRSPSKHREMAARANA